GFANKLYKLDQVLLKESSSDNSENFYRETNTPLAASGNRDVNDVARGALPPQLHPSWTLVTTFHRKFMGQALIFFEDSLTNAINTQARSAFRVAEAIVNAKDTYIYDQLTAATSTSGDVAAADDWNSATVANRDPIGDILIGEGAMMANNYDVLQNGYLLVKPVDYASLLRNSKVINNPSFKTADVVSNGVVGQICGLKIIVSTNVDDDEAMIVMGQRAATWKGVVGLTSAVIIDQGVSIKVRAWEMGHIQITDPQAIYVIEQIDVNI
ncbi:hypothetical protein LCGC14_2236670, partial [marine sediment metagenome]